MNDFTIRVMMIGGRRCGKTSVLAAMKSCFEEATKNTSLTITANDETMEMLDKKRSEIELYYKSCNNLGFSPDNNPDETESKYFFNIGLKGKNTNLTVRFFDFPGEWVRTDPEKIVKEIKNSDVIMIAIDTPYLMEESGFYNENWNKCSLITNLLKSNFDLLNSEPKMILFVPLKCERYKNDVKYKLDNIQEKIRNIAYRDLINHLNNSNKVTVAITPIFTMGTASFYKFDRDENGKIIEQKISDTQVVPKTAFYDFTNEAYTVGGNYPQPKPQYCEQPMIYLLAYTMEIAKRIKNKQNANFWGRLANVFLTKFLSFPSAEDFINERQTLCNHMVRDKDGYCFVYNPLKL